MKRYFLLFVLVLSAQTLAQAATPPAPHSGGEVGNGGDPNEIKFKAVAFNIQQWIESGNADTIQLPAGLSLAAYKKGMLAQLRNYVIQFTQGKVLVGGAEKTCKNFLDAGQVGEILCNGEEFSRLYATSPNDAYRLVHHEFAGLAGFEESQGPDSNYSLSAQVSAFLETELVKRLPVIPRDRNQPWLAATGWRSLEAPGLEMAKVTPFLLDTSNLVSFENGAASAPYESAAILSGEGITLSTKDPMLGRDVEVRGEGEATILRADRGTKLEFAVMRVPQTSPVAMTYHCMLVETGESVPIGFGNVKTLFPSQAKLGLSQGRIVITATDDNIFFSQLFADPDSPSQPAVSRAVVRVKRGTRWAQLKLAGPRDFVASISCEADGSH